MKTRVDGILYFTRPKGLVNTFASPQAQAENRAIKMENADKTASPFPRDSCPVRTIRKGYILLRVSGGMSGICSFVDNNQWA